MPTLEDQIKLETEMVDAGVRRYKQQANKLIEKEVESKTQHGRAMVASVVQNVADGVTKLQNTTTSNRDIARKKLKGKDADQIAYLSLITVIDSISRRFTLLKVARQIGMRIEDQERLTLWLEAEGQIAANVIKLANEKSDAGRASKRHGLTNKMNKDGYKETEWTNEERIHVGLRLVDIIITTTGIISLKKQKTSRNKTTTFVEATNATLEWIQKFNDAGMSKRPRWSPCIIQPKEWNDLWGGGYHSEQIKKLPLVRAH